MTIALCIPPAPVGQKAPPARAAASDSARSLRVAARVPPTDYGDGLPPYLTKEENTEIRNTIQRRRHAPASHWSRCAGTGGRNRRNAHGDPGSGPGRFGVVLWDAMFLAVGDAEVESGPRVPLFSSEAIPFPAGAPPGADHAASSFCAKLPGLDSICRGQEFAGGTITMSPTQTQYSQEVILNFNGLSRPHASVASLAPADPITVPACLLPLT
jgi:hypothetical protein